MTRSGICCFVVSIVLVTSHGRAEVRTVAVTGGRAPATTEGETFFHLSDPQFNNRGEVAFYAELADSNGQALYVDSPDITPDVGIWVVGPTASRLIARQGRTAPAASPGNTVWLIDPQDSDDDRYSFSLGNTGLLFQGLLNLSRTNRGLWYFPTAADPVPVAFTGEAIPGDDLLFGRLVARQMSDGGRALFDSTLHRPDDTEHPVGSSLWTFTPTEGLNLIARSGLPAPGTLPPAFFGSSSIGSSINASGDVVFFKKIIASPDGITSGSSSAPQGIWSGRSLDDLELIALSTGIKAVTINSHGDVAFASGYSARIYRDGQLSPIAVSGQTPPGTTPAGPLHRIDHVVLNDDGKTSIGAMFVEDDVTPGGWGIWEHQRGELRPVAVSGMNAPLQDESVFTSIETNSLSMNEAGQIAFRASVVDFAGDGLRRIGVFAQDIHGDLRVIALGGEELSIGDGDTRTVFTVYDPAINDLGQVVFQAYFTDGSQGIFISDAVVVPEPSSLMLMAWALCIAALRMRRRRRSTSR